MLTMITEKTRKNVKVHIFLQRMPTIIFLLSLGKPGAPAQAHICVVVEKKLPFRLNNLIYEEKVQVEV